MPALPTTRHIPAKAQQYGALQVKADGSLWINATPLELSSFQHGVLLALIAAGGSPVSRIALASITPKQCLSCSHSDTASSRSIDICISRLRKALGSENWRIQTIRTHGYRFDPRPHP